jgi:hypothetical protein
MTYNAPILMNVDTAFNVVLGANFTQEQDHDTGDNCKTTLANSTTEGGCA